MTLKRYALYFAPAEAALWHAGSAWLGRDAETGRPASHPPFARIAAATEAPRRYGFHATLKAPFRLAHDATPAILRAAVAAEAARLAPVTLPGLRVARLGRFLALVPEIGAEDLAPLAAEVVTRFEPFRAPLTAAEIARRRPESLSARQRDLLTGFGYPFVFEEFRFHISLTGDVAAEEIDRLEPLAQAWFAPHLSRPFRVDQLCLFGEDLAGRFHLLSRHALSG